MSQATSLNFHQTRFYISASTVKQCPVEDCLEAAFVGRSNAGKSSAINVLTGQTKLARTSKTPGRTQLLNFFEVEPLKYLVDLPGFGYAKVAPKIKLQWQQQLEKYLQVRDSLQGLVLLMDVRHPFKDFDLMMVQWCSQANMPLHVLLTKADKLKRGPAQSELLKTNKRLAEFNGLMTAQLFSSLNKQGVDELRAKLNTWLNPPETSTAVAGDASGRAGINVRTGEIKTKDTKAK